jgi:hypothetical protein
MGLGLSDDGMTAARLHEPTIAFVRLLLDTPKNKFLPKRAQLSATANLRFYLPATEVCSTRRDDWPTVEGVPK